MFLRSKQSTSRGARNGLDAIEVRKDENSRKGGVSVASYWFSSSRIMATARSTCGTSEYRGKVIEFIAAQAYESGGLRASSYGHVVFRSKLPSKPNA